MEFENVFSCWSWKNDARVLENHGKIMEFDSGKALGTLYKPVLLFAYVQNENCVINKKSNYIQNHSSNQHCSLSYQSTTHFQMTHVTRKQTSSWFKTWAIFGSSDLNTGSEIFRGSAEFRGFSRNLGHPWDQCKSAEKSDCNWHSMHIFWCPHWVPNCNSQAKCIYAWADNKTIYIREVPEWVYAFWVCKPV